MMDKKTLGVILLLWCALNGQALHAQVRLPQLVRDSMVVQRDTKLRLWGWASQGEKVTIIFNKKRVQAITGLDGKWFATLPPMRAGGPYTMMIKASNEIELKNVLVGDVWMCAGQSNMVHQMKLHQERYAADIEAADYPEIRHFHIAAKPDLSGPVDDLPGGYWKAANPQDIRDFSAVAYFFARKIYGRYHVPIGLINASVGGTPIEAWTSEEGLREFPETLSTVLKNKDSSYVNSKNRAAASSARSREQRNPKDRGLVEARPWYDTAYVPRNWYPINIPGYWEDQGIKDLDGVVWYRRVISIPDSMVGLPAKLALGRIVDADFVYVNGVLVGNTTYQYPQRRYKVPAGLLKTGKNTIVIRVLNNRGKGGFVPDKLYSLSAGGQTRDLKGTWEYKVGAAYEDSGVADGGILPQYQPTALFNAMIAPVTNYTIKGILWYQGESNISLGEEYKTFQTALIADWRNQWGLGPIPFLYVQLPNYLEATFLPADSQWALIREAQLKTLSIPNTGMAVTLDLGEWNDIHPDNKKDVGDRLALAAMRTAYGDQSIVHSGPLYHAHKIVDNTIVISFSNVGGGLVAWDGERLTRFAIAGADGKFVWGDATIENNTVVVSSEEIPDPVYVRYAWADNPVGANLYNKEGLPASPFRTDP